MQTSTKHPTLPTTVRPLPREDAIRVRALEIFLGRNGSGVWGDAMSDWLQAEREVLTVEQDSINPQSPRPATPA
jgi:hypothetical protein